MRKAIRTRHGTALLGLPIFGALRESALWVFSALGVILFAALVSYDPGGNWREHRGLVKGINVENGKVVHPALCK